MNPIPVVRGTHKKRGSLSNVKSCLKVELISGTANWLAIPTRFGYSIFQIQPGWHGYFPTDVEFIRFLFEEDDTAARTNAWRVALILNRHVPITGKRIQDV